MSTPRHSVESKPLSVEADRYIDRNNFLNLLLGIISTAEQVMAFIPDLDAGPPADKIVERGASIIHHGASSMMR